MDIANLRQLAETVRFRHDQHLAEVREASRARLERRIEEERTRLASEEREVLRSMLAELTLLNDLCPPPLREALGLNDYLRAMQQVVPSRGTTGCTKEPDR